MRPSSSTSASGRRFDRRALSSPGRPNAPMDPAQAPAHGRRLGDRGPRRHGAHRRRRHFHASLRRAHAAGADDAGGARQRPEARQHRQVEDRGAGRRRLARFHHPAPDHLRREGRMARGQSREAALELRPAGLPAPAHRRRLRRDRAGAPASEPRAQGAAVQRPAGDLRNPRHEVPAGDPAGVQHPPRIVRRGGRPQR